MNRPKLLDLSRWENTHTVPKHCPECGKDWDGPYFRPPREDGKRYVMDCDECIEKAETARRQLERKRKVTEEKVVELPPPILDESDPWWNR